MGDNNSPLWQIVLPGSYLFYGVGMLVWRLWRLQQQKSFPATMLGDLDKALWQADYLTKINNRLIVFYLLPLCVIASVYLIGDGEWVIALIMNLVLPTVGYFGTRWENRKWHEPKKAELLSLREKLLT